MKGKEAKGSQPADLLVCFPSRAHHLTLMQKSICSPARPSESNRKRKHHHHYLKKSSTRSGLAQGSPTPWAKNKQIDSEISEPTSPKVTCAGQIKIRHKTAKPCKSWQSDMEDIERIHSNRKHKQKRQQSWAEAFGLKKEVMQFLTCLRNLRLDFHCFGALPTSDIATEDEEEYQETETSVIESMNEASSSGTVFSKWFMVLQENQNPWCMKDGKKGKECSSNSDNELSVAEASVPPPNALLLMRCRSAPAKEWLKERNGKHVVKKEKHEDGDHQGTQERGSVRQLRLLMEEDKREEEMKKKERLMVMKYDTDIAKETWVTGGMDNPLSRSRSWKS